MTNANLCQSTPTRESLPGSGAVRRAQASLARHQDGRDSQYSSSSAADKYVKDLQSQ